MKSLDRPYSWIFQIPLRWPLLWVGLVLLGIGLGVCVFADQTSDRFVRQSAIERAQAQAQSLLQFRHFYGQALVPRAMRAGVPFTEDERSHKNALPLPATLMADLSQHLSKQDGETSVRFYTEVPLQRHSPERELDAFQKQALQALKSHPDVPFVQEEILNGVRVLRYAQADRVTVHCVACAATDGDSAEGTAKPNEMMGVLEVVVPMASSGVTSTGLVQRSLLMLGAALLLCLLLIWLTVKGFRDALQKTSVLSSERETAIEQLSQEISQRKQEERQRRLSESKLQSVFTSVPEAIVVTDAQRCIVQCNFEAVSMFGHASEDLIGQKVDVLLSPEVVALLEQHMADYLQNRESTLFNQARVMKGRRKNGQYFSLRMTFSEMRVEEESLFVMVMQDFSNIENTQKLLSQAKQKAEQERITRGEFLAKMGYEIRTPMNGIVGMTELAMDTQDRAEQKEYLTLARNSANHLLHIINQILDFSKIEANALKLELHEVSPSQWLQDTVEAMAPWALAKDIDLQIDVSPAVPALVRMDPIRMRQVLTNLIGNAIKFTDLGAVTVALQAIPGTVEGQCVLRISITDTGIGFDPARSASLFNPFNQLDDSDKRVFGSTGLGLAITRSLVHLMGGEIVANGQPELGACFTVTLPVSKVAMAPGDEQLALEHAAKLQANKAEAALAQTDKAALMAQTITTLDGKAPSVLLVEDHEINRKLAEIMIQRMGCQLVSVSDGLQALDAMEKQHFDVVLMDVMMPVMDGITALKLVRERENGTAFRSRVLMVTAHAMAGDRERFLGAGADGYVSKPMSQATLHSEIQRVLQIPQQPVAD